MRDSLAEHTDGPVRHSDSPVRHSGSEATLRNSLVILYRDMPLSTLCQKICVTFVMLTSKRYPSLNVSVTRGMSRRVLWSFLLLPLLVIASSAQTDTTPPRIRGFTSDASLAESKLETEFKAIPSPDRAREWHRYFTAELIQRPPRAITSSPATSPTNGKNRVEKTWSSASTTSGTPHRAKLAWR